MLVRFLTSLASETEAFATGEQVNLPDERAKKLERAGIVELVSNEKPKGKQ